MAHTAAKMELAMIKCKTVSLVFGMALSKRFVQ